MRSVTYSMGVSLDGNIVGPGGEITAPAPDEEIWRLVKDEIRGVGVHLMGRRLYETMLYSVLSPARAPGGSRARGDPHLQLEGGLPPLPRGALAGSSRETP